MSNEMHSEKVLMLSELGVRSKFKVWIGGKGRYDKDKLNSRLTLNHLPLTEELERIREGIERFDILWVKRNKILYHFQMVENNRLSSTLKRCSDELIKFSPETRRTLIIPGGPEQTGPFTNLIEGIETGRYGYWDYLYFDDLKEYHKNPDSLASFPPGEKIHEEKAKVVEVKLDFHKRDSSEKPRHCELKLESPLIGRQIRPGQFLQVLCTDEKYLRQFDYRQINSPVQISQDRQKWEEAQILRRPFSLHRVYYRNFQPKFLKETDHLPAGFLKLLRPGAKIGFDILFKITGKGTNLLAERESGESVALLGPLGNGIREIDHQFKVIYLVGGGIGIAPLFAIAEHLRRLGKVTRVLLGVLNKQSIPMEKLGIHKRNPGLSVEPVTTLIGKFREIGCRVSVSYEEQGKTVVDLLKEKLEEERVKGYFKRQELKVYSCGPPAMLKEVARVASSEPIDCEVLLEGRMACGVGACLSCAVETYKRGKKGRYLNKKVHRKICTDGPLFDAQEINWRQFES